MEFIEYMKFLLQSITFWVIFANIFIDFQLLQYFLCMLILWGNYHFIRHLIEEKYKGDKLILAWIGNFILHLLIPILIIYLRKTFRHPLSLNNYLLGRGFTWFDAGTPERLMESSNIIANIEKQSSFKIGLPEEISLRKGFISKEQFKILLSKNPNPSQRKYLKKFL